MSPKLYSLKGLIVCKYCTALRAVSAGRRRVDGRHGRASQRGPVSGDDRPLFSYAAIMGVFGALLALTRGRLPERIGAADLMLGGVATHKLSRIITKDKVTQPLRAPFTENPEKAGPGEVSEEPAGEGPRRAVGELLSCPYCIAMWVATGLLYGFVLLPRLTRLVASIFTALTLSDFLQIAYRKGQESL